MSWQHHFQYVGLFAMWPVLLLSFLDTKGFTQSTFCLSGRQLPGSTQYQSRQPANASVLAIGYAMRFSVQIESVLFYGVAHTCAHAGLCRTLHPCGLYWLLWACTHVQTCKSAQSCFCDTSSLNLCAAVWIYQVHSLENHHLFFGASSRSSCFPFF